MRGFALAALAVLALADPAAAHKLKLFATVENGTVTGYAFFIGGGRARGADWVATGAEGAEIARGRTDEDGSYGFPSPGASAAPVTVTLDTHEGHIAFATLGPERFGAPRAPAPASAAPASRTDTPAPALSEAELARIVGAAVQREIAPLEARIEELGARLRYADILSGLFLIVGLAGGGLYLRSLRR